jgi:hypothetical protein
MVQSRSPTYGLLYIGYNSGSPAKKIEGRFHYSSLVFLSLIFRFIEGSYVLSLLGTVHSIVTVECAGILPCSTAEETITHIEKTWQRGQVYLIRPLHLH